MDVPESTPSGLRSFLTLSQDTIDELIWFRSNPFLCAHFFSSNQIGWCVGLVLFWSCFSILFYSFFWAIESSLWSTVERKDSKATSESSCPEWRPALSVRWTSIRLKYGIFPSLWFRTPCSGFLCFFSLFGCLLFLWLFCLLPPSCLIRVPLSGTLTETDWTKIDRGAAGFYLSSLRFHFLCALSLIRHVCRSTASSMPGSCNGPRRTRSVRTPRSMATIPITFRGFTKRPCNEPGSTVSGDNGKQDGRQQRQSQN